MAFQGLQVVGRLQPRRNQLVNGYSTIHSYCSNCTWYTLIAVGW